MMSNFVELSSLLERALAEAIPVSQAWTRNTNAEGWWLECFSSNNSDRRKLEIDLHGDVDVRFYVGSVGIGHAPYEANFSVPDGEEASTVAAIAQFVTALLDERLVLVYRGGTRGGREWIEPGELTPEYRRGLEWIASWHGTYDWHSEIDDTSPSRPPV